MIRLWFILIFTLLTAAAHGRAVISISSASLEDPETSENPHARITERVLMDSTIVDKIREAQKICRQSVLKKGKRVQQNVLCPSWKKRLAVIVRWIQNSKIYPYKPLQKAPTARQAFELVKADQANDATYAAPATIDFIESFSDSFYLKSKRPLRVTALTTAPDQKTDFHRSHLTGYVFDVRPLPGDVPTTWREPNTKIYDYKMNRDLVVSLLSRPEVKKIIFNDPRIRNDKQVKRALDARWGKGYKQAFLLSDFEVCKEQKWRDCDLKAHENHLHVELNLPHSIEKIAHRLLEETARPPVRTTGLKEDFGNRN